MPPTPEPGPTRTERDSLGTVEVPADRLYGAQTARSLENFRISHERMPNALIRALVLVKKASALVNVELGVLDAENGQAIVAAADEVLGGRHAEEFPLVVWQTGSGTQTHMNVNEVLANRASEILGGRRGEKSPVHPNDHVNLGQSTNDVFPTALHVAAMDALGRQVIPAVRALGETLRARADAHRDLVKIGRTHLQDATPLTPRPGDLRLGGSARPRGGSPRDGPAPPPGAGHRRHGGGHRSERPSRAGRESGPQALGAHRRGVRDRSQQLRGPGVTRRGGLRSRGPQDGGRLPQQDRERRASSGLGSPRRDRRDQDPGERARQLDHAGEDQPDAVRSP